MTRRNPPPPSLQDSTCITCMEKLDALDWESGIAFSSYGVHIGIRATDRAVYDRLAAILPPGAKVLEPKPMPHLFSLVVGGPGALPNQYRMWVAYDAWVREARARDGDRVLDALRSAVRLKVAEHAPRKVFVHAGTVGWKGKAIVLPGRSHSGKTTLVSELLKAGATYLSDEYAVLDGQGRVHAFPSPLSIRDGHDDRGVLTDPKAFGATTATKPMPVAVVAIGSYRKGATWRPRELGAGQGALALLENTVSARRRPENAMRALHAVAASARIVRGDRGEAAVVAERLLEMVESAEDGDVAVDPKRRERRQVS